MRDDPTKPEFFEEPKQAVRNDASHYKKMAICDDPTKPKFWEELRQLRYNFNPDAPARPGFGEALLDCGDRWRAILQDEADRNLAFRAYHATQVSLCEGLRWQ